MSLDCKTPLNWPGRILEPPVVLVTVIFVVIVLLSGFTSASAASASTAPAVNSISPTSGPPKGGTAVTITGTGLTGATQVRFGTVPATSFKVVSSAEITAVSPAQPPATHWIDVTTPSGTTVATAADSFTYNPVPTLGWISPTSGLTTGGTAITITGTGLTGATQVLFGAVPAKSFTVVSSTEVSAVSPAQGVAVHNVTVTNPNGTTAILWNDRFTYLPAQVLSSVSPTSGPPKGGTTVTLTGTGLTGATRVLFGTVPATSFKVISSSEITAVSPAQAPGTHWVDVTTPSGTTAASAAVAFTYDPVPTLGWISPNRGPAAGGTTVTITGTGLIGATEVLFGTVPATSFKVVSSTEVTAVSPPQPATTYSSVYVISPNGTTAAMTNGDFDYLATVVLPPDTPSSTEPSGVAMPVGNLSGWTQVATDDFNGSSLSSLWDPPINAPNPGSPSDNGDWLPYHAVVSSGMLKLKEYQDSASDDPNPASDDWTGAGVMMKALRTYGMYQIRMRCGPGAGVDCLALLYPTHANPPEIDFFEDWSADNTRTQMFASALYGSPEGDVSRILSGIDMTQWHTYGVIWGSKSITYTVDGHPWQSIANPDSNPSDPTSLANPLQLHLQIEIDDGGVNATFPNSLTPTEVEMDVDWIAVYQAS
jgi:hypothetical protein